MIGYSTLNQVIEKIGCTKAVATNLYYSARRLAENDGYRNFRRFAPNKYLNKVYPEKIFEELTEPIKKERKER